MIKYEIIFFIGMLIFLLVNKIIYNKKIKKVIPAGIIGGMSAVLCAWKFGYGLESAIMFAFCYLLLKVAVEDYNTQKIRDGNIIVLLLLGAFSFFAIPAVPWMSRLVGAVCVSGPMVLVSVLRPGAFGGGDIKLMAVCGLILGGKRIAWAMMPAVFAAGAYCIFLLITRRADRKSEFAFGPFLCIGMAMAIVCVV